MINKNYHQVLSFDSRIQRILSFKGTLSIEWAGLYLEQLILSITGNHLVSEPYSLKVREVLAADYPNNLFEFLPYSGHYTTC
jgi:hypothetical protein